MKPQLKIAVMLEECEKATPGPWQARFIWRALNEARKSHDIIPNTEPEQDWPDAEFIASARTDYPAALKALQVAVETIQDWIEDWEGDEPSDRTDNIHYAKNLLSQISELMGVKGE